MAQYDGEDWPHQFRDTPTREAVIAELPNPILLAYAETVEKAGKRLHDMELIHTARYMRSLISSVVPAMMTRKGYEHKTVEEFYGEAVPASPSAEVLANQLSSIKEGLWKYLTADEARWLTEAAALLRSLAQPAAQEGELRVVFDGPPDHDAGRFVECEDCHGCSVNAGEWRARPDGMWELVITRLPHALTAAAPGRNPNTLVVGDPKAWNGDEVVRVAAPGREPPRTDWWNCTALQDQWRID